MKLRVLSGLLFSLLIVCGCRSAYYSTMETFGVHKRDLLKKSVVAARDDEKAAGQQFTNALTRLKELYGFQGGDLEKTYNELNKEYERSVDRANAVHKRVKEVETVTGPNTKVIESFAPDRKTGEVYRMMRIELTKN